MIELSFAIKCPPINYHLAGTKKIQQELSRPGVLEKFISDTSRVQKLRNTFVGQYSLEMVICHFVIIVVFSSCCSFRKHMLSLDVCILLGSLVVSWHFMKEYD